MQFIIDWQILTEQARRVGDYTTPPQKIKELWLEAIRLLTLAISADKIPHTFKKSKSKLEHVLHVLGISFELMFTYENRNFDTVCHK